MKVLQTIGGFGAFGGGTSTCTYDLMCAMHNVIPDIKVDLLTPDCSRGDKLMGREEDWIKVEPNDCKTPLAISRNLLCFLKGSEYDVYHTNGMWMHVNHATCAVARKRKKPYIITPHGMLYPETLARSYWKKWSMRKIWFDKDIRLASCIHVTCSDELRHIRNLGYNGPIALIGNPVNIPEYTERIFANRASKSPGNLKIAFLGRLHPRKKVENILQAVTLSKIVGVEVFIMGKGDAGYEEFLRFQTRRLGIQNSVHFIGFVSGRDKFEMLSEMDALLVPSDMENFGMIIPEALIVGTPVMASFGTPWKALNDEQCGWWTDNSPESIAEVIKSLNSLPVEDRLEMGRRGRNYIIRTFKASLIASQMLDLYRWLGGEIKTPDFIDVL